MEALATILLSHRFDPESWAILPPTLMIGDEKFDKYECKDPETVPRELEDLNLNISYPQHKPVGPISDGTFEQIIKLTALCSKYNIIIPLDALDLRSPNCPFTMYNGRVVIKINPDVHLDVSYSRHNDYDALKSLIPKDADSAFLIMMSKSEFTSDMMYSMFNMPACLKRMTHKEYECKNPQRYMHKFTFIPDRSTMREIITLNRGSAYNSPGQWVYGQYSRKARANLLKGTPLKYINATVYAYMIYPYGMSVQWLDAIIGRVFKLPIGEPHLESRYNKKDTTIIECIEAANLDALAYSSHILWKDTQSAVGARLR